MNERNKSSTIVIYKPEMEMGCAKRGVNDNMDWFSDLTNGFMSPATIQTTRKAPQKKGQLPISSTSANKKSFINSNNKNRSKKSKIENDRSTIGILKTRKSSKNSEPTALYKSKSTHKSANKKIKKQQLKTDHKLLNESMENDDNSNKSNNKKSKFESCQQFLKIAAEKLGQNDDSMSIRRDFTGSNENLGELLYVTPMKVLDQIPDAVRFAIRRIRNNKQINESFKSSQIPEDMTDDSEESEDSEEINEKHGIHQQNFAEMLGDLHEQVIRTLEAPRINAYKGNSEIETRALSQMNKLNFLQRLQEIVASQ